MTETIEMKDPVNQGDQTLKPLYTFRRLSAEDMFLMLTIIKKIGVKELKKCFDGDNIAELVGNFKNSGADEKAVAAIGISVLLEAVDIIIGNLPKCEKEIYQLLAQVSGLGEDDIKKDMILFTEMVIDFVKKDEFPDFIKVVSRLFK
jgi:hypothetical protein